MDDADPLRILLLSPIGGDNWGGVERWMIDLADHALARGNEVFAAGKRGTRWLEACVGKGYPTTPLGMRGDLHPRDLWALRRLYRRHGIDLVAVKLEKGIRLAWAARLLTRGRDPAILVHAGDTVMKTSARGRFTHRRMPDGYVTPAEYTRQQLLKYGYFGPEKIRMIPNAVRIPEDDPAAGARIRAEFGLEDATVLTVTSRLHERKGHRYLFEALAAVTGDHPRARLLVVGVGREREALEALVGSLGLADAVTFTGFRTDVLDTLRATDVFVLPSLLEGLPYTVLEAMACGRPVLASNVDGLPEAVVDGETGILVPPRDAGALREGLVRLLADPALAARMGAAGRERIRVQFDPDRLLDETLDYGRELRAARRK